MRQMQMLKRTPSCGLLSLLLGVIGLAILLSACVGTPCVLATPAPPHVALAEESGVIYVRTGYGYGPGAVFGPANSFQASDGTRLTKTVPGGFLGTGPEAVYVDQPGMFEALQASDYSLRWQYPAGTVDGLAVGDSVVYLADHSATSAEVVALRASDGVVLWRYQATTGIVTRLTASAGLVSFLAGGMLVTVHASDGSVAWQQDERSLDVSSLTLEAGSVYLDGFTAEDTSGQVEALRASDGTLLWQHKSDQGHQRLLAVQSDAVYLGNDATFIAVRASDGTALWRQPIVGAANAVAAVESGTLYLALMGTLRAFQTSDGTLLWQQPIQSAINGYTYALVATGDTLYLAVGGLTRQENGCSVIMAAYVVQAVRASDGKLLWSAHG